MIDTIDIGSLTKKIRLSKKLSLKDVAGDYLSVSFLSKFTFSFSLYIGKFGCKYRRNLRNFIER